MKLAHWNLGSCHLENKISEIEVAVSRVKPAILGISEANLHQSVDLSLVALPGYSLYTAKTLSNPRIGCSRVVVYLQEGVTAKLREDLMSDQFSSIWIEVNLPGNSQKVLISNIYRDHQWLRQGGDKSSRSDEEVMARWQVYLGQWRRALESGAEVHAIGDFNLDSSRLMGNSGPQQPLVDALLRQVVPLGATQCAPAATWTPQGGQRGQPSGLDHHWTNRPEKISEVEAHIIGKSDHKLICAVRHTKVVVQGHKYVRKRCYKRFDCDQFVEQVKLIQWWPVYECENVDRAVELLTQALTSVLDTMAPVRRIQLRRHYASWLSEDTKNLMAARDLAMTRFTRTRLPEDWEAARSLRNGVNRLLKSEKMRHVRERVRRCEEQRDSGRIWHNIRSYIGWGGTGGAPTQLTGAAGQLHTSPAAMAEAQNQYYVSKVRKIREQLPQRGDPTALLRKTMEARPRPRPAGLALSCVTPEKVDMIIRKLKNSKASGIDNIDTRVIKLARPFIVPAVTHIINLSLTTLTFPAAFKVARVVPLHKGKDSPATDPKSYRPVALLPVLSKVLERVVAAQLVGYLDQHHLLHPQQHAYRSHHSTTTAMLAMYDTWVEAAEHGKIAGVTMIDMSAAFDVVDSSILLAKARLYGVTRDTEQWLWSYLTGRTQCVTIGGATSSTLPLEAGVPQGSILGPALYSLFTSDFPEVVHLEDCPHGPLNRRQGEEAVFRTQCTECGGITCFADDSTFSISERTEEELSRKMTQKFAEMSDYLTANRLCINSAKTHTMIICTQQKRRHLDTAAVTLETGAETITPSPVERLLGVQVQQDLGFGEHLVGGKNSLVSTLTTRISALKRISKVSSFKTRLEVCTALVISKILYVLPLCGGAPEFMLTAVQRKLNEAMRVVTRRRWEVLGRRLTSTADLLRQCGYLSVRQMVHYHSVALVKKVLLHRAPVHLYDVVCRALASGVRHHYPTSTAGTRVVAPARLAAANTSWRWRATAQYAALPEWLKREESLPAFLAGLRQHTLAHVEI